MVDAAWLCMHSEPIRLMLYGENGKKGGMIGMNGEGTVESPIIFDGCTKETFANFMVWLHHA